ncbi:hypothetical protein F8388_008684 [Cannabis sativa]|uniref:RNase H type-1 domain-containing protein n=1 Tax=Cannabis sativa TaxID=3483 RepID=A0A7J6HKK9_CANSA|nr:hypothetical protein F8388_008684 [Cannabis sativa]
MKVDGATSAIKNKSSMGVIRNSQGNVIERTAKYYPGLMSPMNVEAWALLQAVRWNKDQQISIHHIKSDCLNLVREVLSLNIAVQKIA